jgi:hypothetical protein
LRLRRLYLPPVIEKNLKSGYKPPSLAETLAVIIGFADSKLPRIGFIRKRPSSRIWRLGLLYYPLQLSCNMRNAC